MSTFNYAKSAATAQRLLAKFGQTGVLRVPGEPSGPPHNPTPGVPVNHACTFAVLKYENRDIDGTLIKASDKKVYLSTKDLTVAPLTTHTLVIGGADHTIVLVKPLNPAGTEVFYELQVRV